MKIFDNYDFYFKDTENSSILDMQSFIVSVWAFSDRELMDWTSDFVETFKPEVLKNTVKRSTHNSAQILFDEERKPVGLRFFAIPSLFELLLLRLFCDPTKGAWGREAHTLYMVKAHDEGNFMAGFLDENTPMAKRMEELFEVSSLSFKVDYTPIWVWPSEAVTILPNWTRSGDDVITIWESAEPLTIQCPWGGYEFTIRVTSPLMMHVLKDFIYAALVTSYTNNPKPKFTKVSRGWSGDELSVPFHEH